MTEDDDVPEEIDNRPLSRIELQEAMDASLLTGQLLLQNGAMAQRVEESVHRVGTSLGCDWVDVFLSANALIVTTSSGSEFRTKSRRVVHFGGVNMNTLVGISKITHQVRDGEIDRAGVIQRLNALVELPRFYSRWLVIVAVGFACGAFSRLFGADWPVFALTVVAAMCGMFVRQTLVGRNLNVYISVVATAFVASLIAAIGVTFGVGENPEIALAASVLLLVPGVPLINAVGDLLRGYLVIGLVRGVSGVLISLAIATGLIVTILLTNIDSTWPPPFSSVDFLWQDALWAAVAALGFAVLFNVPPRLLIGCAAAGAAGHAVRFICRSTDVPLLNNVVIASLLGAMTVGVLALILAKRQHVPALIYNVTGVIPMVPGTYAFGAMIGVLRLGILVESDSMSLASDLLAAVAFDIILTGLIIGALGLGTSIPALIMRRGQLLT